MAESAGEVVRAVLAAYGAGDLEGALARCSADLRFVRQAAPGNRALDMDCRGQAEVAEGIGRILAEFEILAYETLEVIAEGARVATRQRIVMRNRQTGAEIDSELAGFWTVEDGQVRSLQEFADTAAVSVACG